MSAQQRELELRFLAEPSDVNFGGKVHGGEVMKWIDQAGYACAVGWSGLYCVTVAVGGIQFVAPILIGDLVKVRCQLVHTGTSSMHLSVEVLARDLKSGAERLATHCVITFVALDGQNGKPAAVPKWHAVTAHDLALEQYAIKVMEVRRRIEQEAPVVQVSDHPAD